MADHPAHFWHKPNLYGERDPLGTPVAVGLEVDNVGPWLVTIDQPHHQTHEGERFVAAYSSASVADNVSIVVHLKTGASHSHLVYLVTGASAFTVQVYENPTLTGDGTALTVVNRNRSSTKTSDTTAFHTPTVTDNGTSIEGPFYIGGGAQRTGGLSDRAEEWPLAPNEDYLIVATSRSAGNALSIHADWYDEGAD